MNTQRGMSVMRNCPMYRVIQHPMSIHLTRIPESIASKILYELFFYGSIYKVIALLSC